MYRTISQEDPFKICFVCLGNICRSPTGEGAFQHLVNERGLQAFFIVDSAGTSAYHIGEPANSKSQWVANQNGVTLHSRAARFKASDLEYYDLILAMDHENLANLKALDPAGKHHDKIRLMRDYDPDPGDGAVPDPYYGGMNGFQDVFTMVMRSCEALLSELEEKLDH
ncbi:MAG: low molecular weight phosphotyrosine protein phosphatase [Balneolaceae bacterium]|nr:MAG: low molecular weight phosphotyrosine protein phosphatase [Balneolaceae bacterium]